MSGGRIDTSGNAQIGRIAYGECIENDGERWLGIFRGAVVLSIAGDDNT